LNILTGPARQRLLQELAEARYGSGCSWRNIGPAMIPHRVRNWWDFNRPLYGAFIRVWGGRFAVMQDCIISARHCHDVAAVLRWLTSSSGTIMPTVISTKT
jgi:hypothetical protein